jgi:HAD superfamily hydrolase (TIGR01509 family)
MIKAIIFDCFGVLVEESLKPFYRKYYKDDLDKIASTEESMEAANRGDITSEEWYQLMADLAGIRLDEVGKALDANARNEDLLNYIRDVLKPNYKIGFLSNASANLLDELFLPEDLDLFDAFVISYETGYAKPQAQIYEIAADKLGVRLNECIFIDDREDYRQGAQGVGMHAILYENFDQLKIELEMILDV